MLQRSIATFDGETRDSPVVQRSVATLDGETCATCDGETHGSHLGSGGWAVAAW